MKRSTILFSLALLALAAPAFAQRPEPDPNQPLPLNLAAELAALDHAAAYLHDADVTAIQYLSQPGLAVPSEGPSAESPRPVRRSSRSEYVRLARVPNMLGDSLSTGGQIVTKSADGRGDITSDIPIGVGRSVKIGENNKGLPMDRVYFMYNGFQNALQTTRGGQVVDVNVDRYTMGGEKTFYDGLASLDVRMPFVSGFTGGNPDPLAGGITSGNVGDVGLVLKGLLAADDYTSWTAGIAMTLPTASDVRGNVGPNNFRLDNRAVHVLPYVGWVSSPTDNWFFQSYLQADFAASGFRVVQNGQRGGPVLTEQNFLYLDTLAGRWLYVNDTARYLTGVAGLLELHYITSITDADMVPLAGQGFNGTLGNAANRVDYLNMTAGLQFQLGELAALRVCCVVPLKSAPLDRQFDSEVFVSFNRFF